MTRSSKIIAVGFLIRAFLGQALFWISYLRLPLARSLQLGDGFWFFAADGPSYLAMANTAAAQGFAEIFAPWEPTPSHLFVRLVAFLAFFCGGVASLALLINCAAYVLTCLLLVRMRANDIVLLAITLSPAGLLFSLQLLKDTFFFFLIVLTVAIFRWWQELWRSDAPPRSLVACALAMVAVVHALTGIRWYIAAIVWGASAVFLVLVAWTARRRGVALAASAILFVLLAQCVRLGSLDMPPQIARLLDPRTVFQSKPAAVPRLVGRARRGFDTTPAATAIAPGWRIEPPSTPRDPSDAAPIPQTFAARWITGISATILPRFIAQPLGLVRIAGGRGFWPFAELDTIVFDLLLLYVLVGCGRALRKKAARATPLFVTMVLISAITAAPMIYTVNNFGTLFRLRQMVYVMMAVIPVTLRRNEGHENEPV